MYKSVGFRVFRELYKHHQLSNSRIFSLSQTETMYPLAATSQCLIRIPEQPLTYFLSLNICLFCTFHINRIMQYVVSRCHIYSCVCVLVLWVKLI